VEKIKVKLWKNSYSIFIEPDALKKLPGLFERFFPGKPAAVISDINVADLYGKEVLELLSQPGRHVKLFSFPAGESSKNINIAYRLYTDLIENRMGRDTVIAALGGGVTGDLAGFVAATYLRGVKFVQIPTTLLAQVDSSVGGKTGINHELGKNLIGSFYQPAFVLTDPDVLKTLPKREIISGAGEVIKYGLIGSKNLFNLTEDKMEMLLISGSSAEMPRIIKDCCRIKAKIVSRDEKESGLRKILNFGHTFGHALEQATGYSVFTHGEAVILGMRWASWFSMYTGLLSGKTFMRIENLLTRIEIPDIPDSVNPEMITGTMYRDKKYSSKNLTLILLQDIGKTVFVKRELSDIIKPIDRWLNNVYKKQSIDN